MGRLSSRLSKLKVKFYRPIFLERDESKVYNINIRIRKEKSSLTLLGNLLKEL